MSKLIPCIVVNDKVITISERHQQIYRDAAAKDFPNSHNTTFNRVKRMYKDLFGTDDVIFFPCIDMAYEFVNFRKKS